MHVSCAHIQTSKLVSHVSAVYSRQNVAIYATDSTLKNFIQFFPNSRFKNTSEVLVAAGLIQIENNSTSFAGIYW